MAACESVKNGEFKEFFRKVGLRVKSVRIVDEAVIEAFQRECVRMENSDDVAELVALLEILNGKIVLNLHITYYYKSHQYYKLRF